MIRPKNAAATLESIAARTFKAEARLASDANRR